MLGGVIVNFKRIKLLNSPLKFASLFLLGGAFSLTMTQPTLALSTSFIGQEQAVESVSELEVALESKPIIGGIDALSKSEVFRYSHLPRIIAHRGRVSQKYHENTLEAIQESLLHQVEGIEIDIRLSKDHVPFLYHEDTLEESTNGKGRPEKYTFLQLQKFSYSTPEKERIPSLEDVFKTVGSRKVCFLDVKTSRLHNTSFAKQLVALICKYRLQDTVVIESFNPFLLKSIRIRARDILLMYDFLTNSKATNQEVQAQFDKMPWLLKQPFIQKQIRRIVHPNILGPRWNVDKKILKSLVRPGRPIICWTVDDPKVAVDLFSLGVTGIQTNQTDLLIKTIL